MITRILEIKDRLGHARPDIRNASDITCLTHALFARADLNWHSGKLTGARIQPRNSDTPIFAYEPDGVLIRLESKEIVDIDYSSAADRMDEIREDVARLSEELFTGYTCPEGVYFTPGTPLGKIPHSIRTSDLIIAISLYFHILTKCPNRFAAAEVFSLSNNPFDPLELLDAMLFWVLARLDNEESSFEQEAIQARAVLNGTQYS